MTAPQFSQPIERVLPRLKGVRAAGKDRWMAKCPAHDDKQASLSLRVGADQRVVLYCHANCSAASVVAAMGLTMPDLFATERPAGRSGRPTLRVEGGAGPQVEKAQGVEQRARLVKTYDYTDANGALLFQACRFEPKTFRQRRPNGDGGWIYDLVGVAPVLYRLPELIEATAADRTIYVVEGEKDVDNLVALGYAATTSPMGAGKWREEYAPILADADVVILPDNDDPGRAHALSVAESLVKVGARVRIAVLPNLPPKGDFSDWLAAGGTADVFDRVVGLSRPWALGEPIPEPYAPPKFKLLSVTDLESLPPLDWLIGEDRAGILPAQALLGMFGAPAAGKSFVAADLACTIACRRDTAKPSWFGNTILRGPVLYVAAEGGRGFRHRVIAWRERYRVTAAELDLHFVLEPVNLYGSDDLAHLLRTADLLREPPKLIVFDTVARSMVGGDENSAQDMGSVIDRADRLKRETGASVLLVHHAKKDGDVERGSGALRAGVDTLCLVRDDEEGGRVLTCEKQKDADPFDPMTFYLVPVGDSCVVSNQEPAGPKPLSANQRRMLDTLNLFQNGATSTEWLSASGVPARSYYRVRTGLVAGGFASETERGRFYIQPRGKIALMDTMETRR